MFIQYSVARAFLICAATAPVGPDGQWPQVEPEIEMVRSFALAVVLMGLGSYAGSCALAGERIIEIWNPPEARAGFPPVAANHAHAHRRKIAEHRVQPVHRTRASAPPLVVQTPARRDVPLPRDEAHEETHDHARVETRFQTRFDTIPRIVTPEGNILRVGTGNAPQAVVH